MTSNETNRGLNRYGNIVEKTEYRWDTVLEGTENFVEVTTIGSGGWEWSEFRCWYDTRSGMYYWSLQGGCSCNGFEVWSLGDLSVGDRKAAIKAARESADDYFISDLEAQEGAARIRNFDPRKVVINEAA